MSDQAIAGSVRIDILGNLAPFEAALAKAQQIAMTFDAQISQKLSGAGTSAGLAKIAAGVEQTNALLAKLVGAASPAAASLEKVTGATKSTAAALAGFSTALDDVRASYSPLATAGEQYGASLVQVNGANRIGLELEKQKSILIGGTTGALTAQAGTVRAVASETGHLASASSLGAAQMAALGHSARSAIETLALGVSPLQALTQQANHLSFAFSGPQGVIAASAGARTAFVEFLGSATGIATTAGVAAVAGLAGYVLAARNSIQSVDQVLTEHRGLVDEISKAWPEAAKAAKQYEEIASKIPQSVASADIQDQIKENTRTLNDLMGSLSTRAQMLSQEWGLVGSSGQKAFGDLADVAKSGAVDAADRVQAALGRMRIDPALNVTAHEFAKSLQDDATQAAKLQDALNAKNTFQGIVDNKRASQTLFDLAGGLDGVKASAGGANDTIAKMFGTLNGGGAGQFGIERSLQATLAGFQTVDMAVQEARRNQLGSFLDLDNQLRSTTQEAETLRQAIATAGTGDNVKLFFNDTSGIANANAEIQKSVDTVNRLFDAMKTGNASVNAVFQGIEMVRSSLVQDGLGVDKVNAFLDSLVHAELQMARDSAAAKQLNSAIQAIRDKNITITTTVYETSGGPITVQRPASAFSGGLSTNPVGAIGSMNPNPFSGGSLGGTIPMVYQTPSGPITVERPASAQSTGAAIPTAQMINVKDYLAGTRAAGGPVAAGSTYLVGEHGPEIVTMPFAGNVSTASATSNILTGGASVLKSIEENTFQTVEEIKRTIGYFSTMQKDGEVGLSLLRAVQSAIGNSSINTGSNGGGSSSGFSGGGSSGSGGGSQANPFDYVGGVFYPGNGGFNFRDWIMWQNTHGGGGTGFATGGAIHPGDTQKVEAWKRPDEAVAFFRPEQRTAVGDAMKNEGGSKTLNLGGIHLHLPPGSQPMSKPSQMEISDRLRRVVREELGKL
ncbi:hypothetical protein [Mesorhizobium sp. WSM3626]|uniref:hypothetical protein n=1 Tax=Mesorhizobium sp. WSM3626 TaxID=1040987 RepID=UPI000487E8DD|nr:hypothetical protein [Mesorhizobium sp. WSM3626]